MIKWIFSIFIVFIAPITFAQTTLHVEGSTPNLYIIHTVSTKETLYGISRMFNVTPNELANYNKLNADAKLTVGQQLYIPLSKTNFSEDGNKNAGEVLISLYYTIQPKEGLYRISINHNKVSIDLLKSWNKLSSDAIITGSDLIVGYLKVKQEFWPLLATPNNTKNTEPNVTIVNTIPNSNTTTIENNTNNSTINASSMGGFFEDAFNQETAHSTNLNTLSGEAAAFKSTSGWQDRKYYALMNNVQPGTFIKISNITNGSYVYAKVLGSLPEMKENEGLLIRISNAAAAILSINDGAKATVQVAKPY